MKNIFFYATLFLLAITSCKKSSNNSNNNNTTCTGGSLSCTIDGSPFNSSSFNNTLIKDTDVVPAKRMDIRATVGTQQIILTLNDVSTGTAGDGVKLGTTYVNEADYHCVNIGGTDVCEAALISILNNNIITQFSLPDQDTGRITITSIDAVNMKVSGTFSGSVTASDFSTQISINNGVFTNACYRISH